ncbi:MAG: plasmid mobilization relaxosome protein MobC [Clostridia bacterium]|nr:plasmid mobilization relaxosome protein MobC [Clostridia bacterium]
MKISKSKMIRFLLYYKNIKEAPPVDYTVLIREMRAVGNNLNQLARAANAKGWINEKELRAAILSLRELEKKISAEFHLSKEAEYWQ